MNPDSESDQEDFFLNNRSKKLKSAINYCLNLKPNPTKMATAVSLRDKILGFQSSADQPRKSKPKSSRNQDDRTKLEESFNEISNDVSRLHNKISGFFECLIAVLDRVEAVEKRVTDLEQKLNDNSTNDASYASALLSNPVIIDSSRRLDKLEYSSSEEDLGK